MMKKSVLIIMAAAVFSTIAVSRKANAVPPFARKYKTSCATCHVAFPKLNDFGEAVRLNGFRIPGADELYVKDEPVSLGAKAWKDLWPDAILPGDIPHLPPIGFLAQFGLTQEDDDAIKGDVEVPRAFILLAAGTLGEDKSFFVHEGAGSRYYFQWNNFLGDTIGRVPDRALNLKIGLFEPGVVAFSNARRLTIAPTLFSTMSYDLNNGNGNDFAFDRQIALEFNGIIKSRFGYAVGISQGNADSIENNTDKDVYARVSYKFWGMAPDGSGLDLEESLTQTDNWQDNSVTVGIFGYFGTNSPDDAAVAGLNRYDIEFMRVGFDARLNYKNLDILMGFQGGEDDNAGNDGADVGVNLVFIETDYVIYPWLIGVVRYEDLNYRGPNSGQLRADEIKRTTVGLTALIAANAKLVIEEQFNDGGGGKDDNDAFMLRFDFAF